jgi:hypothetical protein
VFMTPELAITKGFTDFITWKQEIYQLDYIIFDKGYIILDRTP